MNCFGRARCSRRIDDARRPREMFLSLMRMAVEQKVIGAAILYIVE